MRKLLVLTAAIAGTVNAATAQSIEMDSVIIESNRIKEAYSRQNRNVQILDSKQIRSLPVKSVNELLSYLGGVDMRQRGVAGVQGDVSIDGSTFDQVLVLVNGVKMSDPQTGHHLMNLPIPLNAIHHIEVLRGPAARIYGLNAMAGAINIVTKVPQQNSITAQLYGGSSFDTDSATGHQYYNTGIQLSGNVSARNHQHILGGAIDNGNGYRHNTAYESYRLFYQNNIRLNDRNSIEAMAGFMSSDFGANAFYSAPGDKESKEKVQNAVGSIAYNYKPADNVTIRPRISYRYNNDDYIYIRQKPAVYHNYHETEVATGEVQSTIQLGKGIIGAGVEYRNEEIVSTNLGERWRNNTGIYAEYKHYFSDKLNASAGVYANYNSDYQWQLFPGADIGYRFIKGWKLFANANVGQRLPTYTDLYYKGPTNIGNALLQPEYAYQAEGGLQFEHHYMQAQATYFYRRSTDFIDWVRAVETSPWQPRNFQDVNVNGIALQADYNIGEQAGMADGCALSLNLNYTYLATEIEKPTTDVSKYTIEALKHQLNVSARSMFFNKLQVNVNGRYLCRINKNDYTLLDARVGYVIRKLTIYADVNNILGTQYKEIATVPLPGRWLTFGVRATL
jgi:vitamin B12 transporter